jgi:hypothetical protein
VWRRREPPSEPKELVGLVRDLGRLLMSIDPRLEEIVELLREDDGGDD